MLCESIPVGSSQPDKSRRIISERVVNKNKGITVCFERLHNDEEFPARFPLTEIATAMLGDIVTLSDTNDELIILNAYRFFFEFFMGITNFFCMSKRISFLF